jgi:MurNAc alpha-1-phosphate uridylyltransferase
MMPGDAHADRYARGVAGGVRFTAAREIKPTPGTAMVLAAGLGTRMRPLTDHTAKPLLSLAGRSLLDHALNRLAEIGVGTVVVNGHWHADKVAAALAERLDGPSTVFLREAEPLETGGGVRNALPVLGADPFFVINGDAFWLDGPMPALARLAQAFSPTIDALLLVQPMVRIGGDAGRGDFWLDQMGRPKRRRGNEVAPYLYAGVQILRPSLLVDMPEGPFSLNRAWDRAMESDRVRAIVHDGPWFHLSTPADLREAERRLADPLLLDMPRRWG